MIFLVLQIAAAAAGAAILFRALPWPRSWLKRKPWACATCLGGWGSFVSLGLHYPDLPFEVDWSTFDTYRQLAILWFACTAIAALVVNYIFPPPFEAPGE